jgi:hypothetical protein
VHRFLVVGQLARVVNAVEALADGVCNVALVEWWLLCERHLEAAVVDLITEAIDESAGALRCDVRQRIIGHRITRFVKSISARPKIGTLSDR